MSDQKSYTEKLIDFINESEVSSDLKAASVGLVKMFRTKMSEEYKLEKEQKSTEVIDTLNYGKYKGRSILEVSIFDKPYLRWMVKQSFVVSNPALVTAINNALLVR